MTQPTHSDQQRALGRLEGTITAMEKRMDHLERTVINGFKEVNANINKLGEKQDERLLALETHEAEKRGGWKLLTLVGGAAGAFGGLAVALFKYIMG